MTCQKESQALAEITQIEADGKRKNKKKLTRERKGKWCREHENKEKELRY